MEKQNNIKIEGFGGVKFWMQKVAEEHSKLAKERIDRVGILFFQIYNFDKMRDEVKEKVTEDLIKDIENLFGEQADRIKEEYFKLNSEGKFFSSQP